MVLESGSTVATVSRDLGIVEQTLGKWAALARKDRDGADPGLSLDEREELLQLRKDNALLRREREFLYAAALFAPEQKTPGAASS